MTTPKKSSTGDDGPHGFFQRLDLALKHDIPILADQYRMHPKIALFVSRYPVEVAQMRTIACRTGLFWLDYPKGCTDCEEKHNTSQQNSLEASMALKVVRSMELSKSYGYGNHLLQIAGGSHQESL